MEGASGSSFAIRIGPLRGRFRTQRRRAGRITLGVTGLDALLERLAAEGIGYEPIETYSNGVRHVNIPDPDGNAIAFAEAPQAAGASLGSAGSDASP